MRAPPDRGDPRDPDALLARAGVRGDPGQDQHFLVDDRVLDRLPRYASGFDRSHVLEIGAGTGALTDRLLDVSERVTAIERDRTLVEFLRREFAPEIEADRLVVVDADAMTAELPAFTASVSNLPYGVASQLLFRLLPARRPLLVTVQKEFADRVVADAGTHEYGRLSVTVRHYAGVEIVERIPPTAFVPRPPIESAVIRLTPRQPDYHVRDEAFFLDFVSAVFTQRRKTMRNAIRNTAHLSGLDDPEAVIGAADQPLMQARPEALTPGDFAAVANLALGSERER